MALDGCDAVSCFGMPSFHFGVEKSGVEMSRIDGDWPIIMASYVGSSVLS